MASATLTRRGFLGHAAGSYAAISMVAGAGLTFHDPALALIERWNAASAEMENLPEGANIEAFYELRLMPMEHEVSFSMPAATSPEGAVAALEKALSFGDLERQDEALVRSALRYLQTQTA